MQRHAGEMQLARADRITRVHRDHLGDLRACEVRGDRDDADRSDAEQRQVHLVGSGPDVEATRRATRREHHVRGLVRAARRVLDADDVGDARQGDERVHVDLTTRS